MNKSICIVSTGRLQVEHPSRNRVLSIIEGFIDGGYDVCVITMDTPDYTLFEHERFTHKKISFIDTKTASFFKRTWLETKASIKVLKVARAHDYDAVLITIPSIFTLFMSFLLSSKKYNILDVRDLAWEYLPEAGFVTPVAKKVFRWVAYFSVKKFDLISVTNSYQYNYMQKLSSSAPVVSVPNGVSRAVYDKTSTVSSSNSTSKIVSYVGNIGLGQDLSTLVEVSKKLPDCIFNIVGDGTDFERIKGLIDSRQVNIKLYGNLSQDEVLDIYSNSDILYAQLAPSYSGAMPSKLYEYLATGKYIIYGGQGQAVESLSDFDNLSIVNPCSVDDLTATIHSVFSGKKYNIPSEHNKNIIKSFFIRDKIVKNLVEKVGENI